MGSDDRNEFTAEFISLLSGPVPPQSELANMYQVFHRIVQEHLSICPSFPASAANENLLEMEKVCRRCLDALIMAYKVG